MNKPSSQTERPGLHRFIWGVAVGMWLALLIVMLTGCHSLGYPLGSWRGVHAQAREDRVGEEYREQLEARQERAREQLRERNLECNGR